MKPSPTAVSEPTRSNWTSSGAIERLMPSTPMRWVLPKLSFTSCSAGAALSVTCVPPRSTTMVERLAGADADDALHVGEAADRAAVDRQHDVAGLEPGRRGGAVGLHRIDARQRALLAVDHRGKPAKITIARMKLASGPATTMAARGPTF